MAKQLGQIHTVNFLMNDVTTDGDKMDLDLPGELTKQLSQQIRAGNYFKITGIDMTIQSEDDGSGSQVGGGQVSGRLLYYAPTKGRCAAFQGAWLAMKRMLKLQGIDYRQNKLYDFRCPINQQRAGQFPNASTLDGNTYLCLNHTTEPGSSVFDVHNRSQLPNAINVTGNDAFPPGFNTLIQDEATGTDFVLNDTVLWTGNTDYADTDYEEIPFMMSYTPDTTDVAMSFNWRPDPALYLAIMCGQIQVVLDDVNRDGGATKFDIEIAVHVSGWKSIMSSKHSHRRRSRSSKKTMKGKKSRK